MKLYKCTLTGRPTCTDQTVIPGVTLCRWVDDKLHSTTSGQVQFGEPLMHRRKCEHAEFFCEVNKEEI